MTAVLITALVALLALAALFLSFVAMRRSRDAIRRITNVENAPRVDDVEFVTRNGRSLRLSDLRARLTLLVNIPVRDVDTVELAKLSELEHRHDARDLAVVAVPIGEERRSDGDPAHAAGDVPLLATHAQNPLSERLADAFGDTDLPYTKLLIDERGRVIARFAPDTDPRSAEFSRLVEEALAAA